MKKIRNPKLSLFIMKNLGNLLLGVALLLSILIVALKLNTADGYAYFIGIIFVLGIIYGFLNKNLSGIPLLSAFSLLIVSVPIIVINQGGAMFSINIVAYLFQFLNSSTIISFLNKTFTNLAVFFLPVVIIFAFRNLIFIKKIKN